GLNFLTADVLYRWFLGQRGHDFLGRFQPYAGAGIGVVIPHVESTIGSVHFEQYQWHGPGAQGFVGTNFDLTRHWSMFIEYKLSYADLDLSIRSEEHTSELLSRFDLVCRLLLEKKN